LAHASILIADDSPLVLRMIQKMLEGAGFGVVTARDGLEAIEKAVAEDVRLVILDVMMPRMNGYQACRLLKTEPLTHDLPVVILTSRDQAGDRFWGLETGADYYITKDSEPHRILDLVKNILAQEPATSRERTPDTQRSSVDILSRVNELLDRKLFEATILSEIGRVARGLDKFDETFISVMTLVARVVDFSIGAMAFVEEEALEVALMHQRRTAPEALEEAKARLLVAISSARGDRGFRRTFARLFTPSGGATGPEEANLGGWACFPVAAGDRLVGMLGVGGRAVGRMTRDAEAFLTQVANQSHIVMENSRLVERLRNLSIRDSLTELFNHRHSMELVDQEFQRVGRYPAHEGLSLLMIDIDDFKRINDARGHLAGDAVLRDVALVLKDSLRAVDSVGRYGGEEFVVILPHTPRDEALRTAERIRQRVEAHPFEIGGEKVRVTVSVGVATFPSPAVDGPNALVREADRALYAAKDGGRNRVV
jgi:two-component system, cell cycle response regulator